MKKVGILLLIFLILGGFRTFLQAEEKFYSSHRLTREPVLDGKVRDDIAWKNIPQETGFVKLGCNSPASKQTFFKIGFSHEALFIGVVCEEPEMEKITAELGDMENLWEEDSIEIFISSPETDNYYQFIINAIGSRWSYKFVDVAVRGPNIPLDGWQAKTYKGEDYYSLEIRLPFEIFLTIPKKGDKWSGNITRNVFTAGDKHTTWAHLKTGFHEPANFGSILIADELSTEETRKARDKIINIFRKEVMTNLKSVSEYKNKFTEKVKNYPSLQKEIMSFLKNYEEIEKEISQLDTVKEAHLLLEKSRKLIKEPDELKGKILRQTLFDF